MRDFYFHTSWDCFSPFLAPRARSRRRHAHSPRALSRSRGSHTSLLHDCAFNFDCTSRARLFLSETSFSRDPMNFDPRCRSFEAVRDHWRRTSRATATCAIRSIYSCSIPPKTAGQVPKRLQLLIFPYRHGASRRLSSHTMQVEPGARAQHVAARPSVPSNYGWSMPTMRNTVGPAVPCAGLELVARYFRWRPPHFECFHVTLHFSTALCMLSIPSSAPYRRTSAVLLRLRRAILRRPARCFGREAACNASLFALFEYAKQAKIHVLRHISRRKRIHVQFWRLQVQNGIALDRKMSQERRQTEVVMPEPLVSQHCRPTPPNQV